MNLHLFLILISIAVFVLSIQPISANPKECIMDDIVIFKFKECTCVIPYNQAKWDCHFTLMDDSECVRGFIEVPPGLCHKVERKVKNCKLKEGQILEYETCNCALDYPNDQKWSCLFKINFRESCFQNHLDKTQLPKDCSIEDLDAKDDNDDD